jgi:histone acetyltransferase (RNA polymerase elongator complex component)
MILQNAKQQINEWERRRSEWDEIAFYGGTFAGLDRSVRLALYEMARPYPVRVSTCPDSIKGDFIEEAEDNISVLELGVQSLSDEVLRLNGRGYTADDAISLFCALKDAKCQTAAQFMTGLYGETRGGFKESCDRIKELEADFARIYPMLVFSGAPLAKMEFEPLEPLESLLRSAWLFIALTARNIRVIRISLPQGFGDKYGGFYHTSYGDLVKTAVVYANFLKEGVLMEGFNGYRGKLKKTGGKCAVFDFADLSRRVNDSYSFDGWFNDKRLKDFIGELL